MINTINSIYSEIYTPFINLINLYHDSKKYSITDAFYLIGGILFACLKGEFEKTINKVNVKKICDTAFEAQLEKIKSVSLSQNIQPIVEEQLRKIIPVFNEHLEKILRQTQEKYQALFDDVVLLTDFIGCKVFTETCFVRKRLEEDDEEHFQQYLYSYKFINLTKENI